MASRHERQVCPPSTIETAADDGFSIRLIQDVGDAAGNYMEYVTCFKAAGQPCIPWWYSHDTTTEERVVGLFAPRVIPMGFTKMLFGYGHLRTLGTASITWRVYCSKRPYVGTVAFDSTRLSSSYGSTSITTSSDTHAVPAPDTSCKIYRGDHGRVHLILTAQNGDGSSRGALTGFDMWPRIL